VLRLQVFEGTKTWKIAHLLVACKCLEAIRRPDASPQFARF
jgi:hypothetical protein